MGRPGVKIMNYRAFGADPQGFDEFKLVNVLIGKNNSGKSALLDIVRFLSAGQFEPDALSSRQQGAAALRFTTTLPEEQLKRHFQESTSGGPIPGNHWTFGSRLVGSTVVFDVFAASGEIRIVDTEQEVPSGAKPMLARVVSSMPRPLQGISVRAVASERDVLPEADDHTLVIGPDGSGVTTAIRHFITRSNLDRRVVQEDLLEDLNTVFSPDAQFEELAVQQHDDGAWEVFLLESSKGLIPLSKSGSGLKTVIQVLANLHLAKNIDGKDVTDYVFVLEELENNLHPALQRQLFAFLRSAAIEGGFSVFLSTHSNVVIDLFSTDSEAQLLHVVHDGADARVTPVVSYMHRNGVLDDLDVRASDLLQANGIVWVEGPTDRLLFNKWIDLATQGELHEGMHYQCVLYGGRLLAHLTAMNPDEANDELFSMLTVNRNLVFLGDSDKVDETRRLNRTKSRIRREVEDVGGTVWYTKGREIENYLHAQSVAGVLGSHARQIGPFERFVDYLRELDSEEADKFANRKVGFTERVIPHIEPSHLEILDLHERIAVVAADIRRWNGLAG